MHLSKQRVLTTIILLSTATFAIAEVKLPAIFSNHMVLQQSSKIPVWGTAAVEEAVTVTLANQTQTVKTNDKGNWQINLKPMKAGGPHTLTVAGDARHTIVMSNVMIGEVWVCSGQSNMQWSVDRSNNAKKEIAAAKWPNIRLFTVQRDIAGQPKRDCTGKWVQCSPKTIPSFSAASYYFGRHLHKQLKVPVGLIHTSWGGTPAEAWASRETLDADPKLKVLVNRWDEKIAQHMAAASAPAANKDPRHNPHRASGLYNAMIHPLIPYAIRGAIWYQGESNAGRAYQYRRLFPAMIQDWRKHWGQSDFPFLFVQLANFREVKPEPDDSAWAELQEAQLMTLKLPNTGMAVAIDIGEANDIHPKNKQDVGKRLALNALAIAYGRDVAHTGPLYDSVKFENGKAIVTLKNAVKGLTTRNNEPVKGFVIAGNDRKFVWADAKIDGNTVIVSGKKVKSPAAVRYAWADNPMCNLYDGTGLPASPFRTDEWAGITVNNE